MGDLTGDFYRKAAGGRPADPRNGAGGKFSVNSDYLFRDQTGPGIDNGLWGILRVQ